MKNLAAPGFEGGRMTREKSMIGSKCVDLILDLINLVLLHFSILISVGPFAIDTAVH